MRSEQKLLTPDEAAKLKGVSRTAIYTAIADGRLPHTRILGRLALEEADVLAWVPMRYVGRPKGVPVSKETRARMSEAQKRRWARDRQRNKRK